MGIYGSTSKEKLESLTKKIGSSTSFGIDLFPLISYDLTEKISIISVCDFMSLGFASTTYKGYDPDTNQTSNHFGFSTGSTLYNSLSNIKIGFSYKF
jgi:hypothetical protein